MGDDCSGHFAVNWCREVRDGIRNRRHPRTSREGNFTDRAAEAAQLNAPDEHAVENHRAVVAVGAIDVSFNAISPARISSQEVKR
jgi:hypothetical protein